MATGIREQRGTPGLMPVVIDAVAAIPAAAGDIANGHD
jgi:hypothetical protein